MPYITERESFREVLLKERLRDALRRINASEDGEPWLEVVRVNKAVSALERTAALGRKVAIFIARRLAGIVLLQGRLDSNYLGVKGDVVEKAGR